MKKAHKFPDQCYRDFCCVLSAPTFNWSVVITGITLSLTVSTKGNGRHFTITPQSLCVLRYTLNELSAGQLQCWMYVYTYVISMSHADRSTGVHHALEWVPTAHVINTCTFICKVNPLLPIVCTKWLVGFLHMFETQPLMLIGLLSCLEGGGLALLQPGGLGTTPIAYECNKGSIYSSTVLSRFRILS